MEYRADRRVLRLNGDLAFHLASLFLQRSWDFNFYRKNFFCFYITDEELSRLACRRNWNKAWYFRQRKKTVFDRATKLLQSLLKHLPTEDVQIFEAKVGQLITKVFATRGLQLGDCLPLTFRKTPVDIAIVEYQVDAIINIWQGVHVFGLIAKNNEEAPPILLFQGTKASFRREFNVASIAANFDPHGPSWDLYCRGRIKICSWLSKATQNGQFPARVYGYSQGGALALYFAVLDNRYISTKEYVPSLIYDCPGISKEALLVYQSLDTKPAIETYVTHGDIIPKFGLYLVGKIYEVAPRVHLSVKEAHFCLSLLQPEGIIYTVDKKRENASAFRQTITHIRYHTSLMASLYKLFNFIHALFLQFFSKA